MKLSKTAVQAAMAMAYLAGQTPGQPIQARFIATYLGTPPDSALKILQSLARQDLIVSHLGRSGGYCLHKPADEVTLLQIIEAIEGPVSTQIRRTDSPAALRPGLDVLQSACDDAVAGLRQVFGRTTVADLARATPVVAVPVDAVQA